MRTLAWIRALIATVAGLLFLSSAYAAPHPGMGAARFNQDIPRDNRYCLRCHGMETLAYQDPKTGRIVRLDIDAQRFHASNHTKLKCQHCHQAGFGGYPHPRAAAQENLYCLDCHDDKENTKFRKYDFKRIEEQFQKTTHYRKHKDEFSCFSCHDPHRFEVAEKVAETPRLVRKDNAICLRCHGSPARFASLTERDFPRLDNTHDWLPKTELHWSAVRCVECHTPHDKALSHQILGAKKAEKNCVACHTRDSVLLDKLYRHRARQARREAGFANSVLLNDAYVIGATRNLLLDGASFALFGLTVLGAGAHGAARWLAQRRRKRS